MLVSGTWLGIVILVALVVNLPPLVCVLLLLQFEEFCPYFCIIHSAS